MEQPLTLYQTILTDKQLTLEEVRKEFKKLCDYPALTNERKFAGNPLLYHYMLDVLCQVKNAQGSSIKEQAENEERRQYWFEQMRKVQRTGTVATRFFECLRLCQYGINFFKPTVAKFLYRKYQVTRVLDPCAGWGGRLLGAMALPNVDYIGIDTNLLLRPCYNALIKDILPKSHHFKTLTGKQDGEYFKSDIWRHEGRQFKMIWESSLVVPFDTLHYDFVLTSPPYFNLEVYPGMTPYESEKIFYEGFLIPLIQKCIDYCAKSGWVCFNISPKMYATLTETYGFRKCNVMEEMLQQKRFGKDKADKTYCWKV